MNGTHLSGTRQSALAGTPQWIRWFVARTWLRELVTTNRVFDRLDQNVRRQDKLLIDLPEDAGRYPKCYNTESVISGILPITY